MQHMTSSAGFVKFACYRLEYIIFVFQFATQKYKAQDTQKFNFACFVYGRET